MCVHLSIVDQYIKLQENKEFSGTITSIFLLQWLLIISIL